MKRCPDCKRDLDFIEFYKSTRSADGLQRLCKGCENERRRVRRAERRAAALAADPHGDGKRCPRCQSVKPFTAFDGNRRAKDGKQTYCKPCSNAVRREYEERNAGVLALRRAERLARTPKADGQKTCTKCGERKPILSFYAHRGTKDGRATYCMECQKAASREWTLQHRDHVKKRNAEARLANPEGRKRDHRQWWLKLYGLTPESYDQMLKAQNGVCAICLLPERYIDSRTGEPRRLSVDHDHEAGKVRGLLCGRCNRSIGQFADDHERLARASEYLRLAAEL